MPNSLTKDLEIMFEEYIEGYDHACVISMEAETSYPKPQDMQRAGDVFYKPQNYHASVVTGLDVSAAQKTDLIQRMVPTVFRSPDNVVYQLDAKEMRDPEHKKRMGSARLPGLSPTGPAPARIAAASTGMAASFASWGPALLRSASG